MAPSPVLVARWKITRPPVSRSGSCVVQTSMPMRRWRWRHKRRKNKRQIDDETSSRRRRKRRRRRGIGATKDLIKDLDVLLMDMHTLLSHPYLFSPVGHCTHNIVSFLCIHTLLFHSQVLLSVLHCCFPLLPCCLYIHTINTVLHHFFFSIKMLSPRD